MKGLITSLALLIGMAISPTATAGEIGGVWSFETEIKKKGCTITGNMHIELEIDGVRQCSFTSSEVCVGFPEGRINVEQTCRILKQGSFYLIRSRFLQSLTEGYSGASYLPDHFAVKPAGPNRMNGTWHDSRYTDAVTFWRDKMAPNS